jgi:NADH:ubiquinone oxidoreductase subunit 6 (subunit J)
MTPFPYSGYITTAIFGLFVATTVAGAFIAVLSRRIIRSVAGLAVCCIGLAGLYYFLNSPFLALMEILIYVGAVCVTIIFGVMLSEPDEPQPQEKPAREAWWGGLAALVSLAVFWGVARLSLLGGWPAPASGAAPAERWSVEAIGRALLTTYSLPFELISLVLLVAILGALTIARGGRRRS